ncbi:MAG: fimbrillin family protein [Rikenellaceae bacterium]
MRNLLKTSLIAVAALFASCSTHEEVVRKATAEDAISFSTFMDQATKGTILDDDSIEGSQSGDVWISGYGFGIMGYATEATAWADAAATANPNLMYNQSVVYDGSAWTYSPTKFWSNVDDHNYTFFAYAPYSSTDGQYGITLASDNDDAGAPQIKFELQESAADMIDFVAGQEIDIEQQKDAVKFNLKHQLTRVTFSAKTNIIDENTSVIVNSMSLCESKGFYNSATYTFGSAKTTDVASEHGQDGEWSAPSVADAAYPFSAILNKADFTCGDLSTSTVEVKNALSESDSYVATGLLKSGEYLFLLPPNGADGISDETGIDVTISYQVVTSDPALVGDNIITSEKTSTFSLPAGSLKQGKAYNIVLEISLDEIKVSADVIPWEGEITQDVGQEEEEPQTPDEPALELSSTAFTLQIQDGGGFPSYTIVAENIREGLSADDIVWATSDVNGSIITSQVDGHADRIKITAVSEGVAHVYATLDGQKFTTRVTVVDERVVELKGIQIVDNSGNEIQNTFLMESGEEFSITAQIDPANATGVTYEWSMNNDGIIALSSTDSATTTITAKTIEETATTQTVVLTGTVTDQAGNCETYAMLISVVPEITIDIASEQQSVAISEQFDFSVNITPSYWTSCYTPGSTTSPLEITYSNSTYSNIGCTTPKENVISSIYWNEESKFANPYFVAGTDPGYVKLSATISNPVTGTIYDTDDLIVPVTEAMYSSFTPSADGGNYIIVGGESSDRNSGAIDIL